VCGPRGVEGRQLEERRRCDAGGGTHVCGGQHVPRTVKRRDGM
jgi:hypothetical protein